MVTAGKVILVTGANRGLGYCIISVAAKRDPAAHFILACRNVAEGDKAVEQLKNEGVTAPMEVLPLDVTQDDQITQAVESIAKTHGKLDVLVNNAGISKMPADNSLPTLRATYAEISNVNIASLACVSTGFKPLLAKAAEPRVINITSGLASIANTLARKMPRSPQYGSSKAAVNSMNAHLQMIEMDRLEQEKAQGKEPSAPVIKYYVAAPGFLKTAFTRFNERGKDPYLGAEVVVQLISDRSYAGGTQWEYEGGKMQQVPCCNGTSTRASTAPLGQAARANFTKASVFAELQLYVLYGYGDGQASTLYLAGNLPNWEALKAQWDPHNVFGYNHPFSS